jgi:hypothetical protein
LQSGQLDDESRNAAQVLILRAHALAGDAAKVAEQAKAMAAAGDAGRADLEQADALLWLGKKAEALKLLAKKPAGNGSEDNENSLLAQSYAALEQFANATEFGPSSPLRAALTKALGHSFKAALPDQGGKTQDVDLSGSPMMMAYTMTRAPAQPLKQWGNRLLLALCLKAAPGWKPATTEAFLSKSLKDMPGPDDLPGVLVAMCFAVGNPDEACGLASLRAAEKLQDKAPAKK